MGDAETFCVLAFDNSGSIGDYYVSGIYWTNLKNTYDELLRKYKKFYIIEWNSYARHINEQKFLQIIEAKRCDGGTDPSNIWPVLQTIIEKESLQNFSYHIYITTDGQVPNNANYLRSLNEMASKPAKSFIYFWGYAHSMTMNFLDGLPPPVEFSTISMDYNHEIFEHKGTKKDATQFYNELIELPEYKLLLTGPIERALDKENLSKLYINLYRKLAVYSEDERINGDVGKVLKKYVDGINGKVHNQIFEQLNFDPKKFDEAFKDWRANVRFIVETFIMSLQSVTSGFSAQSIISQINNLANGHTKVDRKLNTYGSDAYDRMKKELDKTCEEGKTTDKTYKTDEDEEVESGGLLATMKISINVIEQNYKDVHNIIKNRVVQRYKKDNNKNPSQDQMTMLEGIHYIQCPILLLKDEEYSSFIVLWIGENDKTFDGSNKNTSLLEGPHGEFNDH